MSQKLGNDFEMFKKAYHVCGSFEHLRKDCNDWSGLISLNVARLVNTVQPRTTLSAVKGNKGNAVKASACWGNPQQDLKNKGVIDSGCSRHMKGNRSYLIDYEEIDGGFVADY
ncbi:hypothetical protein Tco_1178620 [Tanacetum coccineum]